MASIIYSELPWGQIRREWETTSISIAALARKYNVRSATTLERKRVTEQWSRALMIEGQVVPFTPGDRPLAAGENTMPAGSAGAAPAAHPAGGCCRSADDRGARAAVFASRAAAA